MISGMENLTNWAIDLLLENNHRVGDVYACSTGIRVFVDGIPRTEREVIERASHYPEWLDRKRRHVEYLQSLQNRLC